MYKVTFKHDVTNCFGSNEIGYKYNAKEGRMTEEYFFDSKEAAWTFFEAHAYGIGAFWTGFEWDWKSVYSYHMDEGGYFSVILDKWEDFDKDVEMYWEYNDKKYYSLEELWELPQFLHRYKVDDVDWIDSIDGEEHAELVVKSNLKKIELREPPKIDLTSCTPTKNGELPF